MFKKAILVIIVLVGLFLSVFTYNGAKQTIAHPIRGQSKICEDVLIMVLNPTIQQGVDNYYKEYLTEPPFVGSVSVEIIDIRNSSDGYDITVDVLPFYGPHNSVGKDEMLLSVSEGKIEIKNFKHLESYEIYGSYRDYIVQWPPQ